MATQISFFIGILGNVISILVFLSPVTTFMRIVKKKSTESFKGLPYVCTLLSTSLWVFYGLLKPHGSGLLVVTVNGAGALLQAIYTILFLIYAPRDTRITYLKLVGLLDIGFYGLVIAVVLLALHGSIRLAVVGCLCAGLTLGMYGSPLAIMRRVIKTKSVEFMPFYLSFFLFLNGGAWSVYAVLVKDFFIGVPNAIGFLLGTVQLIIYTIYRGKPGSNKSTGKKEDEDPSHLEEGFEMGNTDDDKKEGKLSKGRSLPKTSVSQQHSFQKILKASSLSPPDLQLKDGDIENGDANTHNH